MMYDVRMKKDIQRKIICHAHNMMDMYKNYYTAFDEEFFNEHERSIRTQGYRDALESMKRYGLIKDYDFEKGTIHT